MKFKLVILFILSISYLSSSIQQGNNVVYLATFPRSGTHWTKRMIEEYSGILTGAVYKEYVDLPPEILPTGVYCYFAPDGYEGGRRYPGINDIVVIKTHYPAISSLDYNKNGIDLDHQEHKKVIHLVRNPIDSFYSTVLLIDPKAPPVDKIPYEIVKCLVDMWKKFQNYWLTQDKVYTVRYEDLLIDPKIHFKAILTEAGYEINDKDVERSINRYPPKNYEYQHLHHYDQKSLDYIREELKPLLEKFNYQIPLRAIHQE